jgi:GYF domain 2
MDIYILCDGKETGPFTEETTQNLLKQGSVRISDLAWQPGMAQWLPLHSVLYPAPAQTTSQRPPPPPVEVPFSAAIADPAPGEPATAKQKAFLTYIGVPFNSELTKEQAALAVNDAMENPADPVRLARWNDERLRLHPELFAAEIKAKKENRANHFHEIAKREGAGFFQNVTKAHAQVLVGYLDVHFPNWDANEAEATRSYFFPAIAEKFPQLVEKSAKGKFKYPSGSKLAAELSPRVTAPKATAPWQSLLAMVRGLAIGGAVLVALYFGVQFLNQQAATKKVPKAPAGKLADEPAPNSAEIKKDEASGKNAPVRPTDPTAVGAPTLASATPDQPAMNGTDGTAGDPSMNTAPSAPVELAPVSPPAPADPLPVQPKTTFMITKSTEVALPFGRAVLRPGTLIKILAVEGTRLKIRYGNDVVVVPITATDYQPSGAAVAAPPAVAVDPLAPPPTTAPAPPTTPATGAAKPPTSLF